MYFWISPKEIEALIDWVAFTLYKFEKWLSQKISSGTGFFIQWQIHICTYIAVYRTLWAVLISMVYQAVSWHHSWLLPLPSFTPRSASFTAFKKYCPKILLFYFIFYFSPSFAFPSPDMVKEIFPEKWLELDPADLAKRRAELAAIVESIDSEKEKSLKAVCNIFSSLSRSVYPSSAREGQGS